MKRKLVSIQKVLEVSPIEGADRIEKITINGWTCVSKKGEFKKGDLCVYFEIDSFLPLEDHRYEFLAKTSKKKMYDKEGIRLRTIKFRGVLSQGLALPISLFPEIKDLEIGKDVTELLNVIKYEEPIPLQLAGEVVGPFPSFIPKTDEERIQNLPGLFEKEELKEIPFEETMKLDGMSMTVFRTKDTFNEKTEIFPETNEQFGVCMRNFELRFKEDNALWKKAINLKLPQILKELDLEIALQGELMGEKIQGNREKILGHEFFVFRIFDIKKQEFYTPEERLALIEKINKTYNVDLKHVPVLNRNIKIFKEVSSIQEMLERAKGKSISHNIREGIVLKSEVLYNGKTLTFKAINNEFLLKGGE